MPPYSTHNLPDAILLGIAFDPNFAQNRYVYYTATTPNVHNRVSRFTASRTNPNMALPGSEKIIWKLNVVSSVRHNGGALHFGKDGKLYIAVGDGSTGTNAQSLNNFFGKMLRINPDGSVPADNPFYTRTSGRNRAIWALGLRNPFSFAVQPGTGRIYVNDVGAQVWEEINNGVKGASYGWPVCEGPDCAGPVPSAYREPIYAYRHPTTGPTAGHGAITGGAFYNPTTRRFPSGYVGDYFFADIQNDFIRRYDLSTDTTYGFATATDAPVDVDVGKDEHLYYLSRIGDGTVYAIRYAGD